MTEQKKTAAGRWILVGFDYNTDGTSEPNLKHMWLNDKDDPDEAAPVHGMQEWMRIPATVPNLIAAVDLVTSIRNGLIDKDPNFIGPKNNPRKKR